MNAKDRIKDLCKEHNIKPYTLETQLGYSHGALTKGEDINATRLYAVAKYFHVTMEYLMGDETEACSITDFEYKVIVEYRKLPPLQQDLILKVLNLNRPAMNIPNQMEIKDYE